MLFTLILTACTSTTTLGVDALAKLDDVRTAVLAHRDDVDGASSMEDVDQLETDHHADMAAMMDDIDGMMDSMMGCGMDDMMTGSMSDADTHMGEMMDEVDGHEAAHADHPDMQACVDGEETYTSSMTEHLDAMSGDMAGFDDSASCSGGGGGMM